VYINQFSELLFSRYALLLVYFLVAGYLNYWYGVVMEPKLYTSIYVTVEATDLLRQLSVQMGISRNAVLEIAIRWMAKREGVTTSE